MTIPEKEISTLKESLKEYIREFAISLEPELPEFELTEEELNQAEYEVSERTKLKEIGMYARINKIEKELQSLVFKNIEEEYLIFVLGYDLLEFNDLECDRAFEKSQKIIKDFLQSKEYENLKCSSYEALQVYLNNKKEENNMEKTTKLLKVDEYEYWFTKETYKENGRMAIIINEKGTGEYEPISINLPNAPVGENQFFMSSDFLKEIDDEMVKEGLIKLVSTVDYNFGNYKKYQLTEKFEEYVSETNEEL